MQPAIVHRIHEAPPADAFAHARLAETLTPAAPASRNVGATVARWREREADTGFLDLGQFPQLEEQRSPGGFFTALAGLTAVGIFVMIGIGLFAAYAAGRF